MVSSNAALRGTVPPPRWAAVAGAASVTMLAVGGSLGLVPGVADDKTPSPGSSASAAAADSSVDDDAGDQISPGSQPSDLGDNDAVDGSKADGGAAGSASDDDVATTTTALPQQSGSGKRVVYDISAQRVWLAGADDTVAATYLVSGARDATKLPPGQYDVFSKSRDAVALGYQETMRYMVRFAHGDNAAIGFHTVPRDLDGELVQTRRQLGTPLSAGCIRQWWTDARELWRFTEVGTTVVVLA